MIQIEVCPRWITCDFGTLYVHPDYNEEDFAEGRCEIGQNSCTDGGYTCERLKVCKLSSLKKLGEYKRCTDCEYKFLCVMVVDDNVNSW